MNTPQGLFNKTVRIIRKGKKSKFLDGKSTHNPATPAVIAVCECGHGLVRGKSLGLQSMKRISYMAANCTGLIASYATYLSVAAVALGALWTPDEVAICAARSISLSHLCVPNGLLCQLFPKLLQRITCHLLKQEVTRVY